MNAALEVTPRERIEAWAAERGITLRTEFVPFSKSRHAKVRKGERPWRSLNWRVSLMRTDPAKANFNEEQKAIERGERDIYGPFDYSAGEAHCPSYTGGRRTLESEDALNFEVEHGRRCRGGAMRVVGMGGDRILPDLCNVLASIATDAQALNEGSFECWADSLGYDTDSRKAEETYRACIDTATGLIRAVGLDGLQALWEAATDY